MKDNIDRLLEAVEHPERFSDEELDMLFSDPETRGLYETMTRSANLLAEKSDPDLNEEWNRFVAKHPKRKTLKTGFFLNRHSAAAVAAVVVSFAVVAATIGITQSLRKSNTPEHIAIEQPTTVDKASVVEGIQKQMRQEVTSVPEVKVFKDLTFEEIIKDISDYYGARASFKSQTSKNLRLYFKWDQSQPLSEVVEQLNSFEQIDIVLSDNVLTIE